MTTDKLIIGIVDELRKELSKKLGDAIMEEYLARVRAELEPRIRQLVSEVNIVEFGVAKNLMSMREDLNIRISVGDKVVTLGGDK